MNEQDRSAPASRRGSSRRSDVVLFVAYFVLYAGFMALTAFAPDVLATRVVGGVNLAVAYGMGLILAAVLFAGLAAYFSRGEGRG